MKRQESNPMALNETGTVELGGEPELDKMTPPRPDANPHHQVGPSPSGDYDDKTLPQIGTESAREADVSENPIGSAAADGHTTG